MKTLTQLLIEQREKKGISQMQLSDLTGIRQSHLNPIKRGESKPTMPTVFRICKALDYDPIALTDQLAIEFGNHIQHKFSTKASV